jgi:hypothetical protein
MCTRQDHLHTKAVFQEKKTLKNLPKIALQKMILKKNILFRSTFADTASLAALPGP